MPRWGLPQGGGSLYGSPNLRMSPQSPRPLILDLSLQGRIPRITSLHPVAQPRLGLNSRVTHNQLFLLEWGTKAVAPYTTGFSPNLGLILGP